MSGADTPAVEVVFVCASHDMTDVSAEEQVEPCQSTCLFLQNCGQKQITSGAAQLFAG